MRYGDDYEDDAFAIAYWTCLSLVSALPAFIAFLVTIYFKSLVIAAGVAVAVFCAAMLFVAWLIE